MDDDARRDRIEQQLRDERRLRDAAERKLAGEAEKTILWRERAEERAERIDRLATDLEVLTGPLGAIRRYRRRQAALERGDVPPSTSPRPEGDEVASRAEGGEQPAPAVRVVPQLPHLQLASCVQDEGLRLVVEQTADRDVANDPSALHEADLVLIEAAAFETAGPELREQVGRWLELDARQPVVWIGPDAPDALGVTQLLVDDPALVATFDPARDTPTGRPGVVEPASPDGEGPVPLDPRDPDAVRRAARAEAVSSAADPVREGDRRRRHVWEMHHPARIAAALAARAGVSFEPPRRDVAALLVSNRPDDLRVQIPAMLQQLHRPAQLQVGCHGFSSSEVAAALDEVAPHIDVQVHELPAARELGWCLNRVAEASTASVLAKIDDDDHYGPGYFVDALQALEYSRAAMVGRLCAYTYVEGVGRTVLRRLGGEEQRYDSAMVGATMVFRRSSWEQAPFPHRSLGEDVGLQRGARAVGGSVYVGARWDFVYKRRLSANTWQVPDEHFLTGSHEAWDGWRPELSDLEQPDVR